MLYYQLIKVAAVILGDGLFLWTIGSWEIGNWFNFSYEMREDEVGINSFGAGEQKSERSVIAWLPNWRVWGWWECVPADTRALSTIGISRREFPWAPLSASLIVLCWPVHVLTVCLVLVQEFRSLCANAHYARVFIVCVWLLQQSSSYGGSRGGAGCVPGLLWTVKRTGLRALPPAIGPSGASYLTSRHDR